LASDADRDAVVDHVVAAAQSLGFMNIVGHGVPESVIDGVLASLTAFFQSPVEQKQRCIAKSMHGTQRGYTSYSSENINAVYCRKGPPCLREVYSFGPPDHLGGSAFGVNTYPDFVDDFSQHIDDYYAEIERLEEILLEVFTRALAKATGQPLDPQHLLHQIKPNRGLMKAAWYPACEPSSDDSRCGAHTDWGPLTILLTTSPGLEVCIRSLEGKGHEWRSVPVVPGAFTVNVADQLARWSNDRFVSCIHRVNANVNSNASRISIPYFSTQVLPISESAEPKVVCICAEGEDPKYEPLSIRDYLRRNFSMLQSCGKTGGA
jgi:isopenicillin N synthase-like dioxygenase